MQVTVNNSVSRVEGYTAAQFALIRRELSYLPPKSFYGVNYRKPLIDKKGHFATGLLLRLVVLAEHQGWTLSLNDNRAIPSPHTTPFMLRLPFTPYEEQTAMVQALKRAHQGVLVASTGVGKSVVIALLIEAINVPTLIVVPNLNLKEQLTSSLREFFPGLDVGPWGALIAVENIDAIENKTTGLNYGMMILDEYHHAAAKTYRQINKTIGSTIYYRCGLTATPFRSQEEENILMESLIAGVAYRVPHAHAVAKRLICPVEAYVYELPRVTYTGTTWRAVYTQAVIRNQHRNELISNQLKMLQDAGKSALCLVKEIEHGDILSQLTGMPFANGVSNNSKDLIAKFTSRKLNVLIGTTGVLGEGVDTKPAEYIIIAGLGKAKNSFLQWVGRGFRMYPGKDTCKVILFKDPSHKWTRDHYNCQRKILREEFGIEVVLI